MFREADRLGVPREDLSDRLAAVQASPDLPAELVVNDLQPAALSLRPDLEATLQRVRDAGADAALISGSGPTVLGLFADPDAVPQLPGTHAARTL